MRIVFASLFLLIASTASGQDFGNFSARGNVIDVVTQVGCSEATGCTVTARWVVLSNDYPVPGGQLTIKCAGTWINPLIEFCAGLRPGDCVYASGLMVTPVRVSQIPERWGSGKATFMSFAAASDCNE